MDEHPDDHQAHEQQGAQGRTEHRHVHHTEAARWYDHCKKEGQYMKASESGGGGESKRERAEVNQYLVINVSVDVMVTNKSL